MFRRIFNPIISRSFFVFGARGVGKTSWLQSRFADQRVLWIDLLDEDIFEQYSLKPNSLDAELEERKVSGSLPSMVVIDEVQRVPRLLNVAQKWIQREKLIFILTGSSARKGSEKLSAGIIGRSFGSCTVALRNRSALHLGHRSNFFQIF